MRELYLHVISPSIEFHVVPFIGRYLNNLINNRFSGYPKQNKIYRTELNLYPSMLALKHVVDTITLYVMVISYRHSTFDVSVSLIVKTYNKGFGRIHRDR